MSYQTTAGLPNPRLCSTHDHGFWILLRPHKTRSRSRTMATNSSSSSCSKTDNHVPEDKDQRIVQTPYGVGIVKRSAREQGGMQQIELWNNNNNNNNDDGTTERRQRQRRPSCLYTVATYDSVEPQVGSDVICMAGRGRVVDIRRLPEMVVVVRVSSWRLAGRSLVTCYLQPNAVHVVRKKQVYEMSVFEKVERAVEFKQQAATLFQAKDYSAALAVYALAVDAVKYVQHTPHDSPNVVRADLLVVMVTCSNNSGTCAIRLQQWEMAQRYAKQALDLLLAMEQKRGKRIHKELEKAGHTDSKVFGEWQVKSYMILATALSEKGESASAMEKIKIAREIVSRYPESKQLQQKDRELIKLYNRYKEQKKALANKEKLRARAMFADADTTTTTSKRDNAEPAEKRSDTPRKPRPDENTQPWYQDPTVLVSLCGVVGVAGICLVASQLLVGTNKQKRI